MPTSHYFTDRLDLYRAELLERSIPFWLNHALDWQYGGIATCISDAGDIINTDKYLWSQLRAVWTFSALYNHIEPRDEWLAAARNIVDFVKWCGRDVEGQWVFCVDQRGRVKQGATSIYADGFAIYGLTEFARATGDAAAVDLALTTYHNVQQRLAQPGSYRTDPYPLPAGVKAHGVSMIFALAFYELGCLLHDDAIIEAGLHHAREVLDVYRRPERELLYEFMRLDNKLIDSPRGRAIVPGHAIESMWFMIHIFQALGDDDRLRQAVETIRWHIEFGWDETYGGILLSRDAAGGEPWWPFADSKLWWPHTEALYALLLAYEVSGESWCLEWFDKVHDYAFHHYPVPEHGEWTQKLDRQGRPFTETVALPVKDPFHLPRALIYSVLSLSRLAAAENKQSNSD